MQRIVTYVKVHGNGDEFILNGMLNAELKRQRELEHKAYEDAMEWMNMMKKQRNTKRNNSLKETVKLLNAKPCASRREKVKEKIAFIFACIICWAEALGLIKYEYEEGVWKRK